MRGLNRIWGMVILWLGNIGMLGKLCPSLMVEGKGWADL
jgi:hypothetical protein